VFDRKRLIAVAAATALTFAVAAVALAAPSSGFAGVWRSVDCAQWWEDGHVDCSVWGDSSQLSLTIGDGTAPRATFQDSYATVCANGGSSATRWVSAGSGAYEDVFLWLTFMKSGCGSFGQGGYGAAQLYHDPGSDTLWEDEDGDGWGIVWYRLT